MTDILNALVVFANFVLVPGGAYGAQLALGALGITLAFGVLRFSNFAHGDTMALGAMVVMLATWGLQSLGVNLGPLPTALLALPVGIAACAALLLGTERTIFRFYRRRRSAPVIFVIVSVGVMFIYSGLVRFIVGPDDLNFADGARFLISAGDFKAATGLDEGLAIRTTSVITLVVALATMAALFLFLQRTRMGKAMRAYADNEDLARLSGVDPDRVVAVTWVLVAALATVAGTLYGLDKTFKAFVYFQLLLPMFAAAIVGGIGNPVGAILGGFVIAYSEVAVTYAWKRALGHLLPESFAPEGLVQLLGTEYKFAVSFVILVVVLLVRPTGILRGKVI